jgi:hypothetical protein
VPRCRSRLSANVSCNTAGSRGSEEDDEEGEDDEVDGDIAAPSSVRESSSSAEPSVATKSARCSTAAAALKSPATSAAAAARLSTHAPLPPAEALHTLSVLSAEPLSMRRPSGDDSQHHSRAEWPRVAHAWFCTCSRQAGPEAWQLHSAVPGECPSSVYASVPPSTSHT